MRRSMVLAALVLAACGSGGDGGAAPEFATTTTPTTAAAPSSTPTSEPPGATSSTSLVDFGETEGCSADFWANRTDLWDDDADPFVGDEPALRPGSTLETAFSRRQRGIEPWAGARATAAPYRHITMLEALTLEEADGFDGAMRRMLREAAAAYLNAGYESMEFPFRRFQVGENGNPSLADQLAAVLASGEEGDVLALADRLEQANGLGCPL